MTNEEARDQIQKLIVYHALDMAEPLTMALDALEKQIPQKPMIGGYRTKCYNCKHNLPCVVRDGKMKYCPFCGQAIDWSDEHENFDKKETR